MLEIELGEHMTDHRTLKMHREKVRIVDRDIQEAIIERGRVATVCFNDSPYPYAVPMNYGYEWKENLVFYFHMAKEGHRIDLIQKDNHVMLNINEFLDRYGYKLYRKEMHDYRSVNIFGKAEIITTENEDEYLKGFSLLQVQQNNRPPIKRITQQMKDRLYILKITADYVVAKSQYPISSIEEVEMPKNTK